MTEYRFTAIVALTLAALIVFAICYSPCADAPRKDTLLAPLALEDKTNLEGDYLVNGTVVDKEYTATAIIRAKGKGYLVQWASDGSHAVGIGIYKGNQLSVAWTNAQLKGISVYTVRGKTLTGHWYALPSDGELHPETMVKIR